MIKQQVRRRVIVGLVLLAVIGGLATIGLMMTEGLALLDAVYMVVITLSTVGFGEPVGGLTGTGRAVTIWLIIVGVTASLYTVTALAELALDALVSDRRRQEHDNVMIEKLKDHVIVCGYGRVGKRVRELLVDEGYTTVVAEVDESEIERARSAKILAVHGDAARDELLDAAGIDRAATLISCVDDESDNIAIVLSARSRRADLYIIARGGDEESQRKLRLAGADRVVALEAAGAERLARLVGHRELTEFVEITSGDATFEFQIEELSIPRSAPFAGSTLAEAGLTDETGAIVIAVYHSDGVVAAPPGKSTRLRPGDIIVGLGTEDQLDQLRKIALGV